ncbi:hypothetical protein PPL_01949 [Heterostelium album PN500]|uniref:Uncharacterized protein n=1 Tax=Heterostelium pallidum (strain ATCC 26659 / Pp 5 / PN500) TaxID=670386 RepID=D3B0Y2_HETP5|nr:hypothetical protein PPL_01949 [Heterostelium album PN500]EFA84956.1 hypothetical protein PPL_01949 [Heterostelium album PN500]|eukprot:XP_020437066.1 hypothetical protein PPL_01949 [Heterostelium album PN500]
MGGDDRVRMNSNFNKDASNQYNYQQLESKQFDEIIEVMKRYQLRYTDQMSKEEMISVILNYQTTYSALSKTLNKQQQQQQQYKHSHIAINLSMLSAESIQHLQLPDLNRNDLIVLEKPAKSFQFKSIAIGLNELPMLSILTTHLTKLVITFIDSKPIRRINLSQLLAFLKSSDCKIKHFGIEKDVFLRQCLTGNNTIDTVELDVSTCISTILSFINIKRVIFIPKLDYFKHVHTQVNGYKPTGFAMVKSRKYYNRKSTQHEDLRVFGKRIYNINEQQKNSKKIESSFPYYLFLNYKS